MFYFTDTNLRSQLVSLSPQQTYFCKKNLKLETSHHQTGKKLQHRFSVAKYDDHVTGDMFLARRSVTEPPQYEYLYQRSRLRNGSRFQGNTHQTEFQGNISI